MKRIDKAFYRIDEQTEGALLMDILDAIDLAKRTIGSDCPDMRMTPEIWAAVNRAAAVMRTRDGRIVLWD